MKNHCRYLFDFTKKKLFTNVFSKISYVISHVNIIMIYEWPTLKLKMEYTKLFGEVVVYLIFSSENAKFLFLLICEGLFIFSYEDPSSLIPQSKVCSMLISLVYINLGHLKKSQTIHFKKQFKKHENFDCFGFAICCSSSYSNYYCKFLFNFFYLF